MFQAENKPSIWGRESGKRFTATNGQRLFLPEANKNRGYIPAVIFLDRRDEAILTIEASAPNILSVTGKLDQYPTIEIKTIYKSGKFSYASIYRTVTTGDGTTWRPGYVFNAGSSEFAPQNGLKGLLQDSREPCPVSFLEGEDGLHTMVEEATLRPVLSLMYGDSTNILVEDGTAGFPVHIDFDAPAAIAQEASQALWGLNVNWGEIELLADAGEDLLYSIYNAR